MLLAHAEIHGVEGLHVQIEGGLGETIQGISEEMIGETTEERNAATIEETKDEMIIGKSDEEIIGMNGGSDMIKEKDKVHHEDGMTVIQGKEEETKKMTENEMKSSQKTEANDTGQGHLRKQIEGIKGHIQGHILLHVMWI